MLIFNRAIYHVARDKKHTCLSKYPYMTASWESIHHCFIRSSLGHLKTTPSQLLWNIGSFLWHLCQFWICTVWPLYQDKTPIICIFTKIYLNPTLQNCIGTHADICVSPIDPLEISATSYNARWLAVLSELRAAADTSVFGNVFPKLSQPYFSHSVKCICLNFSAIFGSEWVGWEGCCRDFLARGAAALRGSAGALLLPERLRLKARTAVGAGDQGMVLEGWLWDTSTRIAVLVLALFILSNCGGDLIAWSCKESSSGGRVKKEGAGGGERKQVLATITGHCLPKLVCQLHALESREHISDSERNLISLVGWVIACMPPLTKTFCIFQEQRADRVPLQVQLCGSHGPAGERVGRNWLSQLLSRLPFLQPGCPADCQEDQL